MHCHGQMNNRTYSVEDIDWGLNPSKTFGTKSEESITYIQYYKKQFYIDTRDPKQPLMLCKSKEKEIRGGASTSKKIYLVNEMVRVNAGQFRDDALDGRANKAGPTCSSEEPQTFFECQ